jgi:NADH-quinone oxidoreductase subunit G
LRKGGNQWLLVPLHFIFGSEELSANSPSIAQRAPLPFIAMNEQDAQSSGIVEGDEVEMRVFDEVRRLPCRLDPSLPSSVAGVPAGLKELSGIQLPSWASILTVRKHGDIETRFG